MGTGRLQSVDHDRGPGSRHAALDERAAPGGHLRPADRGSATHDHSRCYPEEPLDVRLLPVARSAAEANGDVILATDAGAAQHPASVVAARECRGPADGCLCALSLPV